MDVKMLLAPTVISILPLLRVLPVSKGAQSPPPYLLILLRLCCSSRPLCLLWACHCIVLLKGFVKGLGGFQEVPSILGDRPGTTHLQKIAEILQKLLENTR